MKERIKILLEKAFPEKRKEILILLALLPVIVLLSLLGNDSRQIRSLDLPAFSETDQQVLLSYDFQGKNKVSDSVSVLLPRKKPTEEQIEKMLQNIKEVFTQEVILKQLQAKIKGKPNFPTSWQEVKIKYRFQPANMLTAEGEWNFFELFEGNSREIQIDIGFEYGEQRFFSSISHTLTIDDFDEEYQKVLLQKAVQTGLYGGLTGEEEKLELPEELYGGKLRWSSYQNRMSPVQILFMMVVAVFLFSALSRIAAREKKEMSRKIFLRDFSHMLHRLVLLLKCGKNPYSAMMEVCHDQVGYRQDFRDALEICYQKLYHQESFSGATEVFYQMCPEMEINQFQKLINMAYEKGDEWSVIYLEQLRDDMFTARLRRANEQTQKATSKLMFPMVLFLIVILIMTIFPSFHSVN